MTLVADIFISRSAFGGIYVEHVYGESTWLGLVRNLDGRTASNPSVEVLRHTKTGSHMLHISKACFVLVDTSLSLLHMAAYMFFFVNK